MKQEKLIKRTNMCGDLRITDVGKEVRLNGWVQRRRNLGTLIFDQKDTRLYYQGYEISREGSLYLKVLFVNGYLTVDKDYVVRISHRLFSDYGGGEAYRAYDGQSLVRLPENIVELPAREFLEWHGKHVFLG